MQFASNHHRYSFGIDILQSFSTACIRDLVFTDIHTILYYGRVPGHSCTAAEAK